jgi:nicotinamidase-related amidase
MTTALLIVDVQRSLIEDETWAPERLLGRVNALEAAARAAGAPVVYVRDRNVGPHGDLHAALAPGAGDPVIVKGEPDCFSAPRLSEVLGARGVERVVVCGLQTDCCIDATVRGAAARGYRVVLAADAHSTFDREGATAEEVVAEHNRALGSVAAVLPVARIEF